MSGRQTRSSIAPASPEPARSSQATDASPIPNLSQESASSAEPRQLRGEPLKALYQSDLRNPKGSGKKVDASSGLKAGRKPCICPHAAGCPANDATSIRMKQKKCTCGRIGQRGKAKGARRGRADKPECPNCLEECGWCNDNSSVGSLRGIASGTKFSYRSIGRGRHHLASKAGVEEPSDEEKEAVSFKRKHAKPDTRSKFAKKYACSTLARRRALGLERACALED